jgi:DNA invertase Pin-like site-specific DNA recombinase
VIYRLPKKKGVLIIMVIAEKVNRAAFYCRVNHRDRDYEKYLDDVMRRLEETYGTQEWDLQIFFEEASGADPDRKEFNHLKAEITAEKIDVVVTMKASTLARDWKQFMEFMLVCSKKNVEVVCIDRAEDAQGIFQRIEKFRQNYFEGSETVCR